MRVLKQGEEGWSVLSQDCTVQLSQHVNLQDNTDLPVLLETLEQGDEGRNVRLELR